ncbi:hypothetical protein CYMTET_45538 [Cymbomonas tetramitiformis]|uniref:STI1/HOP DP domain-containing protein n=1 Tax=Cymbomonas tetramitiformis TaxID=36881 RepID=A0AAE0EZL4_9CHLO|nr:hypothetical protein CYMTET_56167 [Cymbomonas tetramitiformis]KAK3244870.1 hypothetical protein CYMTET_45538 [Cymbomonas tetramitiformis]
MSWKSLRWLMIALEPFTKRETACRQSRPACLQSSDDDVDPAKQAKIEEMQKEYEEVMADPEQAKQVQAMQESMQNAMQSPEAKAQMQAMGSFMQNPEVQSKIKELETDPEFKEFVDALKSEGAGAVMKFWNDPEMLKKIGEKLGPMAAQADPNAQAAQQPPEIETLLDAARYGDLEAIEDLLAVGKDCNIQDDVGRTPVHYAVAYDQLDALEELVKSDGLKIDLQDEKDNTALHYAAGYGRLACMKVLLGAGSDTSKLNATGKSALDLATADERNPINADADLLEELKASSGGTAFTDQA